MENTTEVEHNAISDKPKKARGRPCGSKYSDEEQRQRKREKIKKSCITKTRINQNQFQ